MVQVVDLEDVDVEVGRFLLVVPSARDGSGLFASDLSLGIFLAYVLIV